MEVDGEALRDQGRSNHGLDWSGTCFFECKFTVSILYLYFSEAHRHLKYSQAMIDHVHPCSALFNYVYPFIQECDKTQPVETRWLLSLRV